MPRLVEELFPAESLLPVAPAAAWISREAPVMSPVAPPPELSELIKVIPVAAEIAPVALVLA